MTTIFIFSFLMLIYPYVFFPLLLRLLPKKKVNYSFQQIDEWPLISIIIPVYNGAKVIGRKISNVFSLDYPRDKMEVIIISDNSTDGTLNVLKEFHDKRLKIIEQKVRKGKTAAENVALEIANGKYLFFTDSTGLLSKNALKSLVTILENLNIGSVSTIDKIVTEEGNIVSTGENAYVRLEMWMRSKESEFGFLVGASGSCYACPRQLTVQIPEQTTRDFYIPLLSIKKGLFNVTADHAYCYIATQYDIKNEFIRKVRTITNGMATLACHWELLNPFKFGVFSLFLFSHKVLRWLGPIWIVAIFLSNIYLAKLTFWQMLLIAQITIYTFSLITYKTGKILNFKLLKIVNFFLITNVAAFVSILNLFKKKKYSIWDPTNR